MLHNDTDQLSQLTRMAVLSRALAAHDMHPTAHTARVGKARVLIEAAGACVGLVDLQLERGRSVASHARRVLFRGPVHEIARDIVSRDGDRRGS